ncbi:exocyst complex component EXO84B-like [Vicia villosa]|uniref:exocyst complex component EXO84B-like n=1 Tax=Vicia villosa TaxID=3911 RepID=UPI00273BF468|nr:exocyst complex component EXO84B-like [Vicia villosa]
MQMESSSATKFRFRDHSLPVSRNSIHSSELSSDDVVSVVSLSNSIISDQPDDNTKLDIESITGRGIKHLCDELQELKEAANLDLHKNICANYSSFLRILEEVTGVENELVQLENHFLSHQMLVKDLKDRIYPKILSINLTMEEYLDFVVPSPPSELEAHINDVSEKLDILMSENKVDEALKVLESVYEDEALSNSDDEIQLYNTMISEKKSVIIQELIQIVENKRIEGPELKSALTTLCRLGDTQLAIHLLLKYYHLRIVTGTNNLQWSSSPLNEIYIRKLAKFVFSMISQAAKSFEMLCGETSPYASELVLWSYEETMSFINCFDKFVKCTSEVSVGLSSAIKAAKFAFSYCSLLGKNQKQVLLPYLVEHLYPCMEEVLNTHINHFKKVIPIFSVSDSWILEKYIVSGVFGGDGSSTEQSDYCLLTSSGRKVQTLLQAIAEDISPLVTLDMENLVTSGLKNLFIEYIIILESALIYETNEMEQDSPRIKLAESLSQQVSILANLSTLVQFLSTMVKGIFSSRSSNHMDLQVVKNHSGVHRHQELDDFLLFIEESSIKLRNVFCQQLILRMLSTYSSHEMFSAIHYNDQFDANPIHNSTPSAIFQVLFLELRKIEKLEEENEFEVNWLMELLREVMVCMFILVSKNKEINATPKEHVILQTNEAKQFILDVQFLVEIGMYGGYFSTDPLLLLTVMKSTFNSAGLDPFKDADSDDWAIDVATKTIQNLLEIEETSLHPKEPIHTMKDELHEHEDQIKQSTYECNFSEVDDKNSLEDKVESDEHESEVAIDAETDYSSTFSSREGSLAERDCVDIDKVNMRQLSISYVQLENTDVEKITDAGNDELTLMPSLGVVGQNSEQTDSKS